MSKKFLSLALALAMCLGLTVPAFAAGTVKVVEDETHGVRITMNGFLREETHRYNLAGGGTDEFTFYVVADNSTVTIEALEGRKYADPILQGVNVWDVVYGSSDLPERKAWDAFRDNKENYAYRWECEGNSLNTNEWVWTHEEKCFTIDNVFTWPLEKAVTETVSPIIVIDENDELHQFYLSTGYGIDWLCESDYAKLVPVDGGQPTQPTVTTVGGFTDVKTGDYFADPVLWAVEKKITAGTSATTFAPNATCTQSQILTFLWRAKGEPKPTGTVSGTQYYATAAQWAKEQGLTDNFSAEADCTRAMVVTYLWKLAGSPKTGTSNFTDVSANADYAQAVAWAVEQGITSGTGNGQFSPASACTRGQIVTFLYRAFAT